MLKEDFKNYLKYLDTNGLSLSPIQPNNVYYTVIVIGGFPAYIVWRSRELQLWFPTKKKLFNMIFCLGDVKQFGGCECGERRGDCRFLRQRADDRPGPERRC